MTTNQQPVLKPQSAFGQSALELDSDFAEMERLAAELQRLDIETESGLERARKLLTRFSECGQRVGTGVPVLARTLEEARGRAEKAAETVFARAGDIQKRQQEADRLLERFNSLGEMVGKINAMVTQLRKPGGAKLSDEERAMIARHMPEINVQLGKLIDEARKLKEDSHAANMKSLEKNAESLLQSMQAMSRKLNGIAEIAAGPSGGAPDPEQGPGRPPELH